MGQDKGTNTHHSTVPVRGWQSKLTLWPRSNLNGHLTGRECSFPSLLCICVHLKFFDSSRPRAPFIGTDGCQGLHFSPSCIVRESLHGEAEVVVSCDLVCVFSYSLKGSVTNTLHQFTVDQDTLSSFFSPDSNFFSTYGHSRDT